MKAAGGVGKPLEDESVHPNGTAVRTRMDIAQTAPISDFRHRGISLCLDQGGQANNRASEQVKLQKAKSHPISLLCGFFFRE